MIFKYSISKNHYNGYVYKETDDKNTLFTDLATYCVSPVTEYGDSELTNVEHGKTWISKNHRTNATIISRGNLSMIDFEGSKAKFEELRQKMESKNLWYLAIPSQSNKSDKKNLRYHIVYLLTKPFSINAPAMKKQAQAFFDYIVYKWDEPDSGIDTRATFNGCGYFSPTLPLKDAKSRDNKKISDPYIDFDDIFKDTIESKFKEPYQPIEPDSIISNDVFNMVTVRGKKLDDKINTKIIRTTKKGYVLSTDTHIMTGSVDRFVTFEALVEKLSNIQGDNPRISGLGCPICNPGHTELKPGYAYMQYDSEGKPYICCTGNACTDKPFFTMADGELVVYKINKGADYVLVHEEQLIFSHKENEMYEHNSDSVVGELYKSGQAILDEYGNVNVEATRKAFCIQADRLDIIKNPWKENGLDYKSMTYNISKPARFEPKAEDADEVISEAIKVFDNDIKIGDYPAPLVYLSYYLFHKTRIMASLFLVNHQTGTGKTFWTYELPSWYLGDTKVGLMDRSAMQKNWGDVKLGKRLVVYEDIDGLTKQQVGEIASDIKTMATAGGSNVMLDIKGRGQMKSYGYNILGTSNDEKQVPVSGEEDRRIYISEVRLLEKASWIREKLSGDNGDKHKANAINFLYKIYLDISKRKDRDIQDALFYRVPKTAKKKSVTDAQSNDGVQVMNIIRRSSRYRTAANEIIDLVSSDVHIEELKKVLHEVDYKNGNIAGSTLKKLWEMMPSYNSMKSYNLKTIGKIFGLHDNKTVVIHGNRVKGFKFRAS